jgi:hypothetical protein
MQAGHQNDWSWQTTAAPLMPGQPLSKKNNAKKLWGDLKKKGKGTGMAFLHGGFIPKYHSNPGDH